MPSCGQSPSQDLELARHRRYVLVNVVGTKAKRSRRGGLRIERVDGHLGDQSTPRKKWRPPGKCIAIAIPER